MRLMDGSTSLWIPGGYQSDFARNLTREDRDFAALTAEIEVHDCFTPNEYLVSDHIGLTGPGESWRGIENGEIEIGGRLPINPSGGLIGDGHPVGAPVCGWWLVLQSRSAARLAIIKSRSKTFGTLNFGGSTGPGGTPQGVGTARCGHESENQGWAA